jgi:hypothetical protein
MKYELNNKVIIKGNPVYGDKILPENSIGEIIKIRHRYANTPNEYFQYKIHVDGFPDGDDLTNLYTYHNLELVIS